MMDGNSFDFTAIRGVQAGSAYYVIMVPLKVVPSLFKFDDDSMPSELRAQRTLNRARVPEIATYISRNADEYVLSALCASVDGELAFEAAASEGFLRNVGRLRISMSARILINDGNIDARRSKRHCENAPYSGMKRFRSLSSPPAD